MQHRSRTFTKAAILAFLAAVVTLFVAWTRGDLPVAKAYHSAEFLAEIRAAGASLPMGQNTWFMGSGRCAGCHGHDPAENAGYTSDGRDVNLVDDWRSTMMANSAKDPFWRAKVSHEGLVNPPHQAALEDKCTSCHAAQGRYDKFLTGGGPYAIAELVNDSIGLDGVSCLVCHRQSPDSLGKLFSGNLRFTAGDSVYGPYSDNIFGAPMASFVGFQPVFGAHINHAGLCAGCHTLITETADLSGNLTGDHFVEQATYHEWLNSDFNTEADSINGITCQGCHVPRINDPIVLSANYIFLSGRAPFGLHHFAGGNAFMLNLLKQHIEPLGLAANDTQFDSTIARTMRNLQHQSLLVDASLAWRDADTAWIDVRLENLTGHKFPSGYPARRAWVELVITDDAGDTLYDNGAWDGTYDVIGHDASWEPHHDVVIGENDVQIYEMVMGDVNGDKTTVLERAKDKLKDNRLPPLGFHTAHDSYDTAYIANVPASDLDFNHDGIGNEGSASDITHYHVPMNGYVGLIHAKARVWYQSIPPRWNQELFSYNSAAIDSFRTMYEAADNSPILVQEDSLSDMSVGIDDMRELGVHVFPNPVTNGMLNVTDLTPRIDRIEVYDGGGRLVATTMVSGRRQWQLRLPQPAGTWFVVFHCGDQLFVERVVSF